jgi:hypothetical protein
MSNEEITYWAGCNVYIDKFLATINSMHECGNCERIPYCKLKRKTDVWEWSEELERQMDKEWDQTIKAEIEQKIQTGGK